MMVLGELLVDVMKTMILMAALLELALVNLRDWSVPPFDITLREQEVNGLLNSISSLRFRIGDVGVVHSGGEVLWTSSNISDV